jgi:excisionase family DNA binding protein
MRNKNKTKPKKELTMMESHQTTVAVDTPASWKRYYDVRETAIYLGIGESTLRRLIANGIVPNYRIGGSIRIDIRELDELIHNGKLEIN